MKRKQVLPVSLTHAPWIDGGRDQGESFGKIGTDSEHGHQLEGQVRVSFGCRAGKCF